MKILLPLTCPVSAVMKKLPTMTARCLALAPVTLSTLFHNLIAIIVLQKTTGSLPVCVIEKYVCIDGESAFD
jgi:hypothetical protein